MTWLSVILILGLCYIFRGPLFLLACFLGGLALAAVVGVVSGIVIALAWVFEKFDRLYCRVRRRRPLKFRPRQ